MASPRTGPLLAAAAGLLAAPVIRAAWGVPTSIGASSRRIRPTATRSAHFDGRTFRNVLPGTVMQPGSAKGLVRSVATRGNRVRPPRPIPVVRPRIPSSPTDLAATWIGHSSVLLEIDGHRVLADPVLGERVSPSAHAGPRRLHPAPLRPGDLPVLDAIVISHDHYDHLEMSTVRALAATQQCPFLVPLGVGAHLRRWGVPGPRIVELDWDEQVEIGDLTVTCTEARHFSGRGLTRNTTLWASWAITGPTRRVYFGGDTGYTPAFAGIGARYGPFDLTVLPIGAYHDAWPDIHMQPEQALRAHGDLGGSLLLPIHWATFVLAFHRWSEPAERLVSAALRSGVRLALPAPGGRVTEADPPTEPWWEAAI